MWGVECGVWFWGLDLRVEVWSFGQGLRVKVCRVWNLGFGLRGSGVLF